jgi:hypothetical protein
MTTTSPTTTTTTAPARLARREMPMWALGIVALILGGTLWLVGARYTLEGWINALNIALAQTLLPVRVPMPAGWWWALALPLGLVYSLSEVAIPFGPPKSWNAIPAWILMLVALGVLHISDVGSTYMGYALPASDAWPVHVWASSAVWPLIIWSVVLTYLPERLILAGITWIRHALPR